MKPTVVFHDKDETFTVNCAVRDPNVERGAAGGAEGPRPSFQFTVDGTIYISKCRVYFGSGKKWYMFRTRDILGLESSVSSRRLAINSDHFTVEVSCDNAGLLTTFRDLLMLCRSSGGPMLFEPPSSSHNMLPN